MWLCLLGLVKPKTAQIYPKLADAEFVPWAGPRDACKHVTESQRSLLATTHWKKRPIKAHAVRAERSKVKNQTTERSFCVHQCSSSSPLFPSLLLLLLSSSRTEHRNLILCREHAQTHKVAHSLTVSAHANERWPLTPGAYGKNEPNPNVHRLTVFEACSRKGSEGSVSDTQCQTGCRRDVW